MTNDFSYPMMIDLSRLPCAVVGGGGVAARKARAFLAGGARVRVIAPEFCEAVSALASGDFADRCELIREAYSGPASLGGARVVAAATDDSEVNRRVAHDAEASGALVNCATEPELGTFIVPASFSDGALTVSVSASGLPAFSRVVRDLLRGALGPEFAEFASFLAAARARAREALPTPEARSSFWRAALTGEIAALLADGRLETAKERITNAIGGIGAKS